MKRKKLVVILAIVCLIVFTFSLAACDLSGILGGQQPGQGTGTPGSGNTGDGNKDDDKGNTGGNSGNSGGDDQVPSVPSIPGGDSSGDDNGDQNGDGDDDEKEYGPEVDEEDPRSVYLNGLKYTLNDDDSSYSCTDVDNRNHWKNVTIVASVNDLPVTTVGWRALYQKIFIESVTIEEGITLINSDAFRYCENLKSVTIPQSVEIIGHGAFASTGLTSVVIPEGVTTVSSQAFMECTNLTTVSLPNSLESVSSSSFAYCSALQYNEYDNALYLGNSINPYIALKKGKNSDITTCQIHNDAKFLLGAAFSEFRNLTTVTGGNSLTFIEYEAFNNCSNLQSIVIPEGVTHIGSSAFYGCSSLTSITLPSTLKTVEYYAFIGCNSLQSLTMPLAQGYGEGTVSMSNLFGGPMGVENLLEVPKSLKTITVTGGTRIEYAAFKDCTNVKQIILPQGITSIDGSAFKNCASLTSIVIPASVTVIGNEAFLGCSSLASATFQVVDGWSANGTTIASSGLSNTATAANYLRVTYVDYAWKRV